jgi:hypothetical protein
MQVPNDLSPADREIEDLLRNLAAREVRLDPVSAAFAAGRRSSRRQVRLWRAAAVGLLLLGIGISQLANGNLADSGTVERPSLAASPVRTANPAMLGAHSWAMLHRAMGQHGVDGLPTTQIPEVRSIRSHDLF